LRVDLRIDPRQEERRDRIERVEPLAVLRAGAQAAQVGIDHLLVALDREQQCHVDVHPAARQLLDRG
jgi:hypothetical protein